MKLNEKIKQMRLERNWSMQELGSRMNPVVAKQNIYKIEKGVSLPSVETLEELARVFGVVNSYLVEK